MKKIIISLIGFVITLAFAQFSPMGKLDPKLKWWTLESEHFAVHFSDQNSQEAQQELARVIIWYCEDAYKKLSPFMNWHVKQKTNVILGDFYDYVSGWASPFPNNTIFINPTFDKDMRVNYADWLSQLIIHEYTHILNMDMGYGLASFFRKIFGRIIIPNTLMPLFMHEGFTVYNETKFSGFGRSKSSYYKMMMRSNVLANNFFPIDKCVTYNLAQFPSGETPYFYGSQFYEYLAKIYGDTTLSKYANYLSGGLPLFHNSQAKRVFKKSLYKLWQDYKQYSFKEYQEQLTDIQTKPITQSTPITQDGFYHQSPIFSKDANKIYFIRRNNNQEPTLIEYDIINQKSHSILKKHISSPIRISSQGDKLVFSIRDYYQKYYYFDDIYLFDLNEHKLQRVSKGLRASDVDINSDNKQIVFVQNQGGQTNLCLMDLETQEITYLTHSEDLTQYAQPRFSNDGSKIAFAEWKKGGYQDIYIYDLNTEWIIPVTQDQYLDLEPTWSKDDQYLIFVSDRSGVFNIYAYDLKTERLYQVTNVLTGAFSPALSSDNKKLSFQLYSSKGFDIHITDFVIDTLNQVSTNTDDFNFLSITDTDKPDTLYSKLFAYNPFPSIYPKFWLPSFKYDNQDKWSYGIFTYGADALFQHQYALQALYNVKIKQPIIYFSYIYDRLYPTILLDANYEKERLDANLGARFSFLKNDYQQYLTASYLFNKDGQYYDHGLSVFYQFNNAKYFPYSTSFEQGSYLGVLGEIFDKRLLSDHTKANASLVYAQFINLPMKNHILMFNCNIGFTWGDYFYTIGSPNASFVIRGSRQEISAHNGISLITEYRLPILWIERGLGTLPLFFQNISGKVFFDIGTGYNLFVELKHPEILKGGGLELSLQTLCFYQIPVKFIIGIASDLQKAKITEIYFKINPSLPLFNNFLFKNPQAVFRRC